MPEMASATLRPLQQEGAATSALSLGTVFRPTGDGPAPRDPEVQRWHCDPANYPDAAAYFATTFCHTLDEDAGNVVKLIPRRSYVISTMREFDFRDPETAAPRPPANILVEKSRRMMATWLVAAYNVWALQFNPTYSAFVTSNGEDMVDDGTTKGLFGRMRFIHDHLPPHVWRAIDWARMRAKLVEGDSYVVGGAPVPTAGRGGGFERMWGDEHVYLVHARAIHASWDPACKFGKVYVSTTDGQGNLFYELVRDVPFGWRLVKLRWTQEPRYAVGLRPTVVGRERERYGQVVSPWLERVTATLTDELIQQEYNCSYNKASIGMIFKEWDREADVAQAPIALDPKLPVVVGVDYGSTGFGAAVVGQPVGDQEVRVIADYELSGAGGAPVHAANIWDVVRSVGYSGRLEDVLLVGGPDTDTVQTGSGQSIAGYFRAFGFTQVRQCRLRGPGSVKRRIEVVRVGFQRRRVVISPTCRTLIYRIPQYRWPVNRTSGFVGSASGAPALGDANHICDALGYLVCEVLPAEERVERMAMPSTSVVRSDPLDADIAWAHHDRPIMPSPGRDW